MGIQGLLPFLERATRTCHVSEFRGGTVAVDSYCFLHKGANACAEQLARGEDNQMYVHYCIKYVKMLLSYDIHPIMVFDGRNLPAKAETEAKRRESRKKAKQRAAELLRLGKTDEARTYLKQCIDITPKMAHNLIRECHKLNVDCIVAPYESDAQMAYLNIKGIAECIITEDSDLVLFGCKKVLYKLDLQGAGRLVEADKIIMTMNIRPDQFTFDKFRFMCILSGCDYVNSLSGIGLKKAEKFLKLTAETNPEIFLDRIPRYLNMKHLVITEEYKKNVLIANATFLHQVVFDPYKKKLVHLTDPEVTGTNPEYLINSGEKFDNGKAYQIALGNLNPYNYEEFDNWSPTNLSQYSIWSGIYKKRISRKQQKEMQKTNLKNFISTGNVARLEEQQMVVEDNQIDEDLLMYTKTTPESTKQSQESDTEAKLKEPNEDLKSKSDTSPILSRNPFLRKKRISKFPKTYLSGDTIVKSRFFSSNSESNVENQSSETIQSENTKESYFMEKQESIKQESDLDESQNDCGTISDKPRVPPTYGNPEEILKSCENTNELISKKRCFEEVIIKEENEDKESITQVIDIDCTEKFNEEIATLSVKTNEEKNYIKKRKIGPCRTVGLRKKSAGQHTLHNFFSKLNK